MKKRILAFLCAIVTSLTCISMPAVAETKLVTAALEKNEVTLKTDLFTGSYSTYHMEPRNWNNVCPISDFVDNLGRYTIAYATEKYVYISHIDDSLKITDTLKIKTPMTKIGGVTCDKNGNFYIACGQYDKYITKICTFAIYKYNPKGKYIGKAEYYPGDDSFDTKIPFNAGNCAMAFQGDLLICSYARIMYNGHQSNSVFCVDTSTMTENPVYDSYTSHSFNQAVLPLGSNKMVFADHGDGAPRGFAVNIVKDTDEPIRGHYNKGVVPFHFYGDYGENYTNARLTGIAELDSGVALVGSSAISYSENYNEEKQQLFLQILDKDTGESILNGSARPGTDDKGIIWLTNYTDGSEVRASAMAALDSSRLLVMWERWNNDCFINSYYSIISSDGKILKSAINMQRARINGAEELKLIGDKAYWTYADGDNTAYIYRMDTSTTSSDIMLNADITLNWTEHEYTGKALKPTVTVKYDGKTLKKGTNYTLTYKNNIKPGIASVTVKGKGVYVGSRTLYFTIRPNTVRDLTVKRTTSSKNTISWGKIKYANGYEIMINEQDENDRLTGSIKEVIKTTSKNQFTHNVGSKSNVFLFYCVRPYCIVNGKKIYGEWSNGIIPC